MLQFANKSPQNSLKLAGEFYIQIQISPTYIGSWWTFVNCYLFPPIETCDIIIWLDVQKVVISPTYLRQLPGCDMSHISHSRMIEFAILLIVQYHYIWWSHYFQAVNPKVIISYIIVNFWPTLQPFKVTSSSCNFSYLKHRRSHKERKKHPIIPTSAADSDQSWKQFK